METKTSKILKSSFISEWAGQNGVVYYHEIELANGDRGQIGTKEKNPAKLNSGTELTYTLESTPRGNKIKAVVAAGNQFQGKGRAMPEPRIQMISFAAAYTKDLIVAKTFGMDQFEKEFNRIYNVMISKI